MRTLGEGGTDQSGSPEGGGIQASPLSRSIGLTRTLFQSIASMGPGASIVFGLGLIIAQTGKASPFTQFLALLIGLCVAASFAQLSIRMPGAGGLYSYAAASFGPSVGFLTGWTYAVSAWATPPVAAALFGIVAKDFCNTYLGFNPPWWPLALIVLAATLFATYRGIRPSTSVTLVLGALEVSILFLVMVLMLAHAGRANTFSVFSPAHLSSAGQTATKALFLGMVYAVSLVVGFESTAFLGEEATNPRRTVPRALLASAGLIGLFYVFAMYTAVIAWGPNKLPAYIQSPDPWRAMSGQVGKFASVLVVLAILNSLAALTQAAYTATTRLLFAMARAGNLPGPLAKTHPRFHSPYVAAVVTGVLSVIAMFAADFGFHGPFNAYVYLITILAIAFVALYIVTCLGCIVFFLVRRREEFNVFVHLVVPLLALAFLVPVLYYTAHGLAYPASWSLPSLIIWVSLGIVVLGVWKAQRRDIGSESRRWLEELHGPKTRDPQEGPTGRLVDGG